MSAENSVENLCIKAGCKFPCCCRGVRSIDLKANEDYENAVSIEEMNEILKINPQAKVAAIYEPNYILDLPSGGVRRMLITPNGCPLEDDAGNCSNYENRFDVCKINKRGGQLCKDSRSDYGLPPIDIAFSEILP